MVYSTLTSTVDIRNAGQIDLLSLKTRAEVSGASPIAQSMLTEFGYVDVARARDPSVASRRYGVYDVPCRSYAPMVLGRREALLLRTRPIF